MELTVGRFLRFLVILFFIAVIGWLLYNLREIITILIIASLISYILDPIASYLEARGLSRIFATTIIFLTIFLILLVGGWLVIPGFFNELFTLQTRLADGGTDDFIQTIESFIKDKITFIDVDTLNLKEKVDTVLAGLADQLLLILGNAFSIISVIVIIPFIVFFLLKDGRNMKKRFIFYVPNRYFEMTLNVLHKIDQQLGGYLRGQFTEAFVVGLLSVIALWLLDVPYFILIGVFAGLANMIPYVGPVAGAVPAIAVTLVDGGDNTRVIYIISAFTIVQLIDNVLLQPMVLSKSVNLHPLIIVLAILIGGSFFGLLGMLLAVPAAGIIKVTSSELYDGIKKFHII
jgi:putative permease